MLWKGKFLCFVSFILIFSIVLSNVVLANDNDELITINGESIRKEEFEDILNSYDPLESQEVKNSNTRFSAGVSYFIPGIGKVLLVGTGVVIVGGVTCKAGSYVFNAVMDGYVLLMAYWTIEKEKLI